MPKSKVRRKPAYTPPPQAAAATTAGPSHPAYVVIMLAIGLVGLAWLVVNYLAGEQIPFMADAGWLQLPHRLRARRDLAADDDEVALTGTSGSRTTPVSFVPTVDGPCGQL